MRRFHISEPCVLSLLQSTAHKAGLLACCACVLLTPLAAQQPISLAVTSPARLVDCSPVTLNPCLGAGVTPIDAQGKPAPVDLPPPNQLRDALTLNLDGVETKPFYAGTGESPDASQHTSVVLMLVDISGSMNEEVSPGVSRFAAVQSAIGRYLDSMQEGSERIAILPFESHDVVPTIRSAVFTTNRAQAKAQLRALPLPGSHNNTALYQAVFSSVQTMTDEVGALERAGHGRDEIQPHIVVMTDGKNEVGRGDDPNLLNGPLGLQQAAAQVQSSGFDVVGIGFGKRSEVDADALRRMSRRFFFASDADQLLGALHVTQFARSHALEFTFLLPERDRIALIGHDPQFSASLRLPNGRTLISPVLRVIAPAMGEPVYRRHASAPELAALIAVQPPASSGWSAVLVGVLIFCAAAVLLVLLWFWVPRLIWGGEYVGLAPVRPSRRWSKERATTASGVQLRYTDKMPAGFEPGTEHEGLQQRSAAQITQVQPRTELSRTRLVREVD